MFVLKKSPAIIGYQLLKAIDRFTLDGSMPKSSNDTQAEFLYRFFERRHNFNFLQEGEFEAWSSNDHRFLNTMLENNKLTGRFHEMEQNEFSLLLLDRHHVKWKVKPKLTFLYFHHDFIEGLLFKDAVKKEVKENGEVLYVIDLFKENEKLVFFPYQLRENENAIDIIRFCEALKDESEEKIQDFVIPKIKYKSNEKVDWVKGLSVRNDKYIVDCQHFFDFDMEYYINIETQHDNESTHKINQSFLMWVRNTEIKEAIHSFYFDHKIMLKKIAHFWN